MINLPFKNSILSALLKQRIKQINNVNSDPLITQEKIFTGLIKKGLNTKFGNDHSFSKIKTYDDYKKNIPVRKYEEIFPYIEQMRLGKKNILWPGKTFFFAKSSGTTNAKSKYIPLSNDTLYDCHFKGGKDMLAIYLNNNPESRVFNGKGIMLGGSKETNNKIIEGDLSAILLDNFPFWVNSHRIPDIETALSDNWNEKLEKISEQSINQNITNLTGVPSWMLILLSKIIKKTGVNNINDIWPNLELYMHGGVNFQPYKNQFSKLIGNKKMNYLEAYNASEGFFAIQDQKTSKEMLLMLDYGVFYEFIKKEDYDKQSYEAIGLKDVKLNTYYILIISTNSGLWRYQIGDIIEFTSINPFRIIIKGRVMSCLNTFGEELIVNNSDNAIELACKKTNSEIVDYTVAPIFISNSAGSHEWAIEFKKAPQNTDEFMQIIDDHLKHLNSDYEAKRFNDLILKNPKLNIIKRGVFLNWLSINNKLGGQNKISRLNEKRTFIEEIKKLNL